MLEQGILLPPSQFECWFVSLAHDEALIDATIEAAAKALAAAKAG
jgi:glutamate-1-semialdehyde 2,1-aminomutase